MCTVRNGVRRDDKYILAVDVGTASIRCHVYDRAARSRGFSSKQIQLLYPNPGWVEMDPDLLFEQFVTVVKNAVEDSGLQMKQMAALGISAQRATFVTWNKTTGKPFHNFICWQDLRAAELVRSWNNSFLLQTIHMSSRMLHFLTRQKRFLAASVINFSTQHVSLRLAWVLQNLQQVQDAAYEGNCCFGTIDTWLLHKLTDGAVFATDFSNASTTAMFDPFQMCWSEFLASMLSFPLSILPAVEDTSHNFGLTDSSIFGVSIPITALVADQQSAMFGECCFDIGDVKLTMGSGTFLSINTGTKPHASVSGLYPLVAWKIGPEITYLAEGNSADTGIVIKWAKGLGFFSDPSETEKMAQEVQDSDGVFFVPSFSGLQVPVNDPYACASFMGLKPSTTKNHLIRAILESIAFRNKQLYTTMLKETQIPVTYVRADGGISNNGFVMQLTSDLLTCKIEKPQCSDMSSLGAAFLAGLAIGFWDSKAEVKKLRMVEKVYNPRDALPVYDLIVDKWEKAIKRSMHWYCQT
ncbi:putative glycerol kinase 5 isoform X2 [Callorhinchus milii]|uniref:putative glycerol kinase 5 isoform X2 n=1 Tax=Callorhinchus milii TaxID=7868 RepID=UPI0004574CDD|nr:putative glycerol kinase 5 isoform X2 [Callorhinchus milii]|eukprot:gi/632933881/ref/XP_007891630.1/ PREDICTED: putative glycerol kinase 5 isoform X2 [Callorhinchus milii]